MFTVSAQKILKRILTSRISTRVDNSGHYKIGQHKCEKESIIYQMTNVEVLVQMHCPANTKKTSNTGRDEKIPYNSG